MQNLLLIEGRKTIGGGQIMSKTICKALASTYHVITFLPGDEQSPVANLLKDYEQTYFKLHEYSRGNKSFLDYFKLVLNCLFFFKIRRVINNRKVDFVYVQHTSMLPSVILATIGCKVKIIVHIHVVFLDNRVKKFVDIMLKYKKVKKILGVSEFALSQLDLTLMKKTELLYNPVKVLENIKNDSRTFNIAIIGDVIPLKGHHVLFQAVSELPNKYTIHVIGNVVDKKYKKALVEKFPHVKSIFTGMITDVFSYMKNNSIDITATTTTTTFETFSLAMVESWSMGIPTIATNDFGMKELVNRFLPQYSDVILFENQNSSDLRDKIYRMETDNNLYCKISNDVRNVVCNNLNEIIFSEKLKCIMSNL